MLRFASNEKVVENNTAASPDVAAGSIQMEKPGSGDEEFEVFKKIDGAVDFRTVSWVRASVIFLKCKCLLQPESWKKL